MEFVFVVPRAQLFGDASPQGLVPFRLGAHGAGLSFEAVEEAVREHGFFVEREYAERTPELKQVIPYTLVQARSCSTRPGGEERILLMRRLGQGGEARLHQKLSIGVGGHINPRDLGSTRDRALLAEGARRELEEELVLEGTSRLESVGLLNDDANPVGAVHVGLVQVLDLDGSVRIREEDVLEGRLVSAEELRRLRATGANFETWSSLLIERLDELLPVTNPTRT
jgi:predicted NUDIX family phosphoesterase